jgi:nucleoside-diphosphate-sugar epimerase
LRSFPVYKKVLTSSSISAGNASSPIGGGQEGTVLVTGASGFVGQHLVRLLSSKGMTVRALYRNTLPGADLRALPGVSWMQCDLLDIYAVEEAMQDITDVYHCAAIVSFHPSEKAEMMHVNVETTANIVNQSLEQGIRKLAFVSSVAALGRTEGTKVITEEEEWEESRYNSAYSLSKYMAEMEVWRGIGEGLNAVIVNPGIILGEGNWDEGSARLMKVAYKEFPFYTKGITSWADVKDVVHILWELMQSDTAAERFIVSAGDFSYREIFTMMAEALHKKPPHILATPFLTGLLWRWNALKKAITGKTVTITKETARNAQKISRYDNSKLLRFLPSFSYTPVADTIKRIAVAYLRQMEQV